MKILEVLTCPESESRLRDSRSYRHFCHYPDFTTSGCACSDGVSLLPEFELRESETFISIGEIWTRVVGGRY